MIVLVSHSCGFPLLSIKSSSCKGTIQIIQDFPLETVHKQLVSCHIGEGDIGDVDLLSSVGEEQRVVAVRAGLDAVSVAGIVVESDVVDADVTQTRSDDSLGVWHSLRIVGLGLADDH